MRSLLGALGDGLSGRGTLDSARAHFLNCRDKVDYESFRGRVRLRHVWCSGIV